MIYQHLPDVSRETKERLDIYAALLRKWNPVINLVASSTLDTLWERHFLDSSQLWEKAPEKLTTWCDIGTGGGFPGLILSILAKEKDPDRQTICIESDLRKATFLRTVIRETDLKARVVSARIESAPPQSADIISCRALAPLNKLMGYAKRHLSPSGQCLFLKGENYQVEIQEALETWRFEYDTYPSKTNPDAVILKIGDLDRA